MVYRSTLAMNLTILCVDHNPTQFFNKTRKQKDEKKKEYL
jgi:hypothetical protein